MDTPFLHLPTTGKRLQQGVSLLTIALLLLMIGGALLAGVAYFRAKLPSELASSQKEALSWADKALIGYASVHHRLPCPASTPDGEENCDLSKGWLPAKALDLDATMFAPGALPMRYMVYRNRTPASEETFAGDLAWHEPSGKNIPANSFEPVQWDEGSGRYSGRYDFDARNGLDMCETMRLAHIEIRKGGSSAYAHFKNGATPINVAYGVAIAGANDASGNNQPFDGANVSDAPEMEAPDRQHDAHYNDYVFVRDVASLMSAFGCQPVDYHVSADYTVDAASGSGISDTSEVAGLVDIPSLPGPGAFDTLEIVYERDGVASPMLASLESIAMAVDVIEEVNGLYNDVRDNAEETMNYTIAQVVIASVGVIVSTISLIADVIGIGKAVAAAIASLGFHVGAYVAIAFYTAATIISGIAIVINEASVATLIAGAVMASLVAQRLGGDSQQIVAFCDALNDTMDGNDFSEAIDDAIERQWNTLQEAEEKKEAAKARFETARGAVDSCYKNLEGAPSMPLPACPSQNYGVCGYDTKALPYYGKFYDVEREALFGEKKAANEELSGAKKELETMEKKISDIDDLLFNLDNEIENYKNTLRQNQSGLTEAQIEALGEKQRNNREKQYNEERIACLNKITTLESEILVLEAKTQETDVALNTAITALPEFIANVTVACTAPEGNVSANCNVYYREHCMSSLPPMPLYPPLPLKAYEYITMDLESVNRFLPFHFDQFSGDLLKESAYYALWADYTEKLALYEKAYKNWEDAQNLRNPDTPSCQGETDRKILIWSIDDAVDILRKADKRGILQ